MSGPQKSEELFLEIIETVNALAAIVKKQQEALDKLEARVNLLAEGLDGILLREMLGTIGRVVR